MSKPESKWLEQETQRDLGTGFLQSIREMKAGLIGHVTLVYIQNVEVESGIDHNGVEALAGVGGMESKSGEHASKRHPIEKNSWFNKPLLDNSPFNLYN